MKYAIAHKNTGAIKGTGALVATRTVRAFMKRLGIKPTGKNWKRLQNQGYSITMEVQHE